MHKGIKTNLSFVYVKYILKDQFYNLTLIRFISTKLTQNVEKRIHFYIKMSRNYVNQLEAIIHEST